MLIMMMEVPVFKTFGKGFQDHLKKYPCNHEYSEAAARFRSVDLRKNLIEADRNQKTGTQYQKIFGQFFFFTKVFAQEYSCDDT